MATLQPAWFFGTAGTVTASPAVVGGVVYDGDSAGVFDALDAADGAELWSFDGVGPQSCILDQPDGRDEHQAGFGEITASPTVGTVDGVPTVYVGVGATLFAIDATTGRCLWGEDTDPGDPTSAIEIESSPAPLDAPTASEAAIVGDSVYIGTGNAEANEAGVALPPQVDGIWAFSPAPVTPPITPPPTPGLP